MKKLKAAATRKLGPLPVWAWLLIAVVAFYTWRSFGGSGSSMGGPFAGNPDGTMAGVGGQYPQNPPPQPTPTARRPGVRTVHGHREYWHPTGGGHGYWGRKPR